MKDINGLMESEDTVILSPKELEILQWVADGFTAQEVAARVNMGKRNVERIKAQIVERTEAKNLLEVIVALYKKGILV